MISSLFSQESSPCEDELYLELKKKKLDDMSDREYEYFREKDKECWDFNKINKMEKVRISDSEKTVYQPKFNKYGGLMFSEGMFASSLYYRLEKNWGGLYLNANTSSTSDGVIYDTKINGLVITYDFSTNSKYFTPQILLGVVFIKNQWDNIFWNSWTFKTHGHSIRCLKD